MPKTTLPEPWLTLSIKECGIGKLAEYFGVAPSTIRRWAHGMKMNGSARKLFVALCKKYGVDHER